MLAHGIGARADLPIPLWLALYGSGAVVLISFLAVALLWQRAVLDDPQRGRTVPLALQRALESSVVRLTAQVIALAATLLVVTVALTGSADPPRNIAPWALYVTFWVGLIPLSLLLGPFWRYVNPLRLLHRLLPDRGRPAPAADRLERVGLWPAAGALCAFVWLELVYPERATPAVVGVFLVLYGLVQLAGSWWCGERWFEHADGFEVYSTLLARLSPWGVREDGRWVLRNPLRNAADLPETPGLAAVAVVLIGSTAFDGLTRTELWTTGPGKADEALAGTVGLATMIAVVGVLYVLGTRLNGTLAGDDPARQPSAYAHTVLPIALGYAVAHYFSLLVLDGQRTWILASNPFDQDGVDVLGTYANAVDYAAVSPAVISYVQVGAILTGHVLGVVLAHDRSLRGVTRTTSSYEQLPLVVVMIAFTMGGLGLLLGA